MAEPHVATGELTPLFPDWRLDPMPLTIAFPPNRHVSTKLRVFIDWVVALMGQYAPAAGAPAAGAQAAGAQAATKATAKAATKAATRSETQNRNDPPN